MQKPQKFIFQLERPTDSFISKILNDYSAFEGDRINEKLSKLFDAMPNNNDFEEVMIKVAALNTIYSTSINFIQPVVKKIVSEVPDSVSGLCDKDFVRMVDRIATVEWTNQTTEKSHKRSNMSFASKYVHFLSVRKTPIYDSYIWIIIQGYFMQFTENKVSFSKPSDYKRFYQVFQQFKTEFNLTKYSNYSIDKFLWQYGKNSLNEIVRKHGENDLSIAKRILQNEIKTRV